MVLPLSENVVIEEETELISSADLPTKTYNIDFERGRAGGFIDGLKAMEQAIYKMFRTVRFAHMIYSDDYGFEHMIGENEIYVRGDLPRRIKEMLLQDERITAVEDFHLEFVKDEAFVSLTAVTIYGDVNVLREVIKFV